MEKDMNQLSLAESLLLKYDREENMHKAMNIFSELLESKSEIPSIVISKLFECFVIANNRTRISLIFLMHKHKEAIEKDHFLKYKMNDLIEKVIKIITLPDTIARICSIELLIEVPFVINLECLHIIFDIYDKQKGNSEERGLIEDLFKEIIRKDLQYKSNVQKFIAINQIILL